MAVEIEATLRRIDAATAARALAGVERFDPTGACSAAEVAAVCEAGECFQLVAGDGLRAVYVVSMRGGVAWITALQGAGPDVLGVVDQVVQAQARGQKSIALQTKRRGLVRRLERRGYRVAGWVLTKDLQ